VCSAYFYQNSKIKGIGGVRELSYGRPVVGAPSQLDTLRAGGTPPPPPPPDYVRYHELISTSKEYMSCVTAVWRGGGSPNWVGTHVLQREGESFKSALEKWRRREHRDRERIEREMEEIQGVEEVGLERVGMAKFPRRGIPYHRHR